MSKVVVLGAAHPHVFDMAAAVAGAEGAELVGVWDEDASRRGAASQQLGVEAIDSLDRALAMEPSLVLCGAVPCDRAGLARRAIEVGAAALVDKPLAVTHQELDETIKAVEHFGRPVITFYPYRGEPFIQAAKAALDAGHIGKIVRVMSCGPHKLQPDTRPAWHWTRRHNGGCMIDVGSHHADICCWLADQGPDWISSIHVNISQPAYPEFQDFAQAQLRFPNGAVAHVEADWLTPCSMQHFGDTRTWIQGTTGKIEVRLGDERSGYLWTAELPQQTLDTSPYPGLEAWTTQLIEDLCAQRSGAIDQVDVWRASRVSLCAFDSAQEGGRGVRLQCGSRLETLP